MGKTMNWKGKESQLRTLVGKGMSNFELAKLYGTSYSAVKNALKRFGIRRVKTFIPEGTNPLDVLNQLREEIKKATPYQKMKIDSVEHSGDTLVIQLTDWHVGRIVKDEVGKVVYDESVFIQRIDKLLIEILSLLDKNISKGTPIKDVVIISTGDIADGQGIFATQETLQELSPPFQVMTAVRVFQKLILSLLKRNLNVYFYGVKGNHGEIRIGGKNRDPNANWDFMIYLILDFWQKTVLKSSKLSMNYSELDYLNFTIQGWRYHIRHIAPKQAETAAGKAKFLGWIKKHDIDALVYGHYHHWGVSDRSGVTIFRGGSIPGSDEFAESLSEESDPTQIIWGCNIKRPLTFFYPVDLGRKGKR